MIRIVLLLLILALSGCAANPTHDGRLPVVSKIQGQRVVYVPVETTRDDLRECLAARRAAAIRQSQIERKKNGWRKYAERLERLLGIDTEDDDK